MTQEEALLLLWDFCDNPYHLLPILYEPSTRSSIANFYAQLENGQEGDPTVAALILSIASTCASFSSHSRHSMFGSIEEADQASTAWRENALTILDDTQFSTPGSLERCQARTIITYVVSNVEGCSVRYRYLHSCTVAVARDMSLHLIDSPVATDKSDDMLTKEIKRRLWWHLASTDWLLSLVGGPLDGTYSVQPRHFVVKRPRNINDSDLGQDETFTYPPHVLTRMAYFLQRIRLSEICREMADSRSPGFLGVDITDFDTVSSLDRLFEKALAEMPLPLQRGAPIPPGAPSHLIQQRDLILICFNFRRARLHRPFLLHDTDNPLHEASRRQCLASARTVLSMSSKMLEEPTPAVDPGHDFGHPLAYRAGLVISGMFTACVILALNAGLIWSRTKGDADRCSEAAKLHSEITDACRILAKAGEKSVFAANLVRNLVRTPCITLTPLRSPLHIRCPCANAWLKVGVLKQYSIKDIDHIVASSTNTGLNPKNFAGSSDDAISAYAARDRAQSFSDMVNATDDFTMWNGFFTNIPEMEEYDQLFAGLDYYCGPT
ncbi:hypothetical protein F5B22DRAFT_100494 [Xylaria bambusicola]|uniref:uncharacterized protein n=1 Tax=Xylaria bambusicola TaxID=326684 RepID=UPI002007F3ED|nr:uncharacterized protein F5B22DRAFT_100494 [Xylaria bambusicola]KAI0517797.1 hypothetical protein F5B22DRAFT_100494 [Xylaria bambusicola]